MEDVKDSKNVGQNVAEENFNIKEVHGEYIDLISKKLKCGKEITIIGNEGKFKSNLIVEKIEPLLAGLLLGEGTFTGGILYHALGHGNAAWDVSVVAPLTTDTALYDEYYRKAPSSITYLDPSTDLVTATITKKIEITTIFDYVEPAADGSIREQGLIGGDGTSYVVGSTGIIAADANINDTQITLNASVYSACSVGDWIKLTDISSAEYEFRRINSKDGANQVSFLNGLRFDYVSGDSDTADQYTCAYGHLINEIRHKEIFKDSSVKITRKIRLTL